MGPRPSPKHRKKLILAAIIILLAGIAIAALRSHKEKVPGSAESDDTQSVQSQTEQATAINGLQVPEEIAAQRPIAIVVENHPDARPQAGLSRADIVYETLAEGGITRYLALFQTQPADNIGPVRSARIYFGELADQWHAVLAHVGGNSVALTRIAANEYKNITDINEYSNGSYFRRVAGKPAPHNVYTSIDRLRQLMAKQNYPAKASNEIWQFKDDSPAEQPQAKSIVIPFSTPGFTAKYNYSTADNEYLRLLAGRADKDDNNQLQLRAKTIIVQFAVAADFPTDAIGTISLKLTGSGKALVFQDGAVTAATWRQNNGFTRYFDESGRELSFNRGPLWVEIVPTTLQSAVTYTAD